MRTRFAGFRTGDGILDIEVPDTPLKPTIVRVFHDEMEFKNVDDFDAWIGTLQAARDEFTAVRAT